MTGRAFSCRLHKNQKIITLASKFSLMSRTDYLTFAIVAVCVAALAFLIYKMATVPSQEQAQDLTEQAPPDTLLDEEPQPDSDVPATGFGDERPAGDDTGVTGDTEDKGITAVDEFPAAEPAKEAGAATVPESYSSNTSGDYLVLAGSFRETVNAENMAAKVKKLGYGNASVEKFDRGTFAVVLVERFGTYGEASALVKELQGKGIEATVHKKR